MKTLVDDQLGLLIRLDALDLPRDVDLPVVTVYGFDLRLATAIAVERSTAGVLQRLLKQYNLSSVATPDLLARTERVQVLNPARYTLDVALAKAELRCNILAAEVVASARRERAAVRLAPGNADGQLRRALETAGIDAEVWAFEAHGNRLSVVVP